MASHNAASWHGLRDRGAVAPGRRADLLLLPDLEQFEPDMVLKGGRLHVDPPAAPVPEWARRTVRVQPLRPTTCTPPATARRSA